MSHPSKPPRDGHINYGWAAADQLAAARELSSSFKLGKEKPQQRGPSKKEQIRPYEQPRQKQQTSYQNHPSSYSESADSGLPLPSQREFDTLGSFAPGARTVSSAMSGRINGNAMKSFLAHQDEAVTNSDATHKPHSTQSAVPPTRPAPSTAQPAVPAASSVQPAPVVRGPIAPHLKAPVSAPGSSGEVVDNGNQNGQKRSVANQQALEPTSKTVVTAGQASPAVQSVATLPQDAAADRHVSVATRQVGQQVSTQTQSSTSSNAPQPARPPPNDVLAQLQRRFLGAKASSTPASTESSTNTLTAPSAPTASTSTKRESLESSTDSSVIAGLEKLTLEDSKDHETSNDAVKRPSAGPVPATPEAPPQQLSAHTQKKTSLPKEASSWVRVPAEHKSSAVENRDRPSTGTTKTNAEVPSSAATTRTNSGSPPQKTSAPLQKRTLLPKHASSWLQQTTDQKARTITPEIAVPPVTAPATQPPQPTTVSRSKENLTSTSTSKQTEEIPVSHEVQRPQKKKGPGLESSMWASGSTQEALSKGSDPSFNAQAQAFVPYSTGDFSQAQIIVQSSMGTRGYSNNRPYPGFTPSLPSSSTPGDQDMSWQRKEMPAPTTSQPEPAYSRERKGLKSSCWNF